MAGYRTTDCSSVSEADLEQLGNQMMETMIGDPALHERAEAGFGPDSAAAPHLMMGRMATGCYPP